jgi:hypothetical protein
MTDELQNAIDSTINHATAMMNTEHEKIIKATSRETLVTSAKAIIVFSDFIDAVLKFEQQVNDDKK